MDKKKKQEKEAIKGAVAVKYSPKKDIAPKIAAKGWGETADRILKIAKENNIPIKEDRELLQILSKLEINETIPPYLYKVVAEVLAFVYQVNKEAGNKNRISTDLQ